MGFWGGGWWGGVRRVERWIVGIGWCVIFRERELCWGCGCGMVFLYVGHLITQIRIISSCKLAGILRAVWVGHRPYFSWLGRTKWQSNKESGRTFEFVSEMIPSTTVPGSSHVRLRRSSAFFSRRVGLG